jgi:hypothetical protein
MGFGFVSQFRLEALACTRGSLAERSATGPRQVVRNSEFAARAPPESHPRRERMAYDPLLP